MGLRNFLLLTIVSKIISSNGKLFHGLSSTFIQTVLLLSRFILLFIDSGLKIKLASGMIISTYPQLHGIVFLHFYDLSKACISVFFAPFYMHIVSYEHESKLV